MSLPLLPAICLVVAFCLWAAPMIADEVASDDPSRDGGALIENGDFEAAELNGWSLLMEGDAEGSVGRDASRARDESGPHSLRLTVTHPDPRCGVVYDRGSGVGIEAGQWYDLGFFARTEKRDNNRGYGLTVSLESRNGRTVCARTTIPEVEGDWSPYTLVLHPYRSDPNARLVITMSEPGTIWLDDVSLTPRIATEGK